jgi:nicotinate-nucleotide--dimethylbenzimidazole phosphoribosyltransferase
VSVVTSSDRAALWRAARAAVDAKTKPLGALGRLEELAVELAVLQRTLTPSVDPARLVVFGADHGVAAEGVSAYPPVVTAQMMANLARGGAAACVFSRALDVSLEIVDVGVTADLSALSGIVHAKVRPGTANLATGAAMTVHNLAAAMEVGREAARRADEAGCRTLALGEMGIANTTAAAALASALTGAAPEVTVGRGTGVDDQTLAHKRDVVSRALARHARPGAGVADLLASLGGLEIAAITGGILEASECGLAVVVDGFIVSVAALAAVRLEPRCRAACFFGHRSVEPGHVVVLEALRADPLLDLRLRLGEGTGALLALPLLRAACAMLSEMATFAAAGVSEAEG